MEFADVTRTAAQVAGGVGVRVVAKGTTRAALFLHIIMRRLKPSRRLRPLVLENIVYVNVRPFTWFPRLLCLCGGPIHGARFPQTG